MIAQELKTLKTGKRELRNFGLLVGGVFLLLGLFFWYKGKTYDTVFFVVGAPLVVLGAIVPRILRPVFLVWMGLAICLGLVVSTILLTIFFYVVLTPVGWLARLSGKDFLQRKMLPPGESYWVKRELKEFEKASLEQQF